MAASNIAICNMALGWLGANSISALDGSSNEAIQCALFYDSCLSATLEARDWGFAGDRDTLTPEVAAPDHGYTKKFALPTGLLKIRKCDSDPYYETGTFWVREGDYILSDVSTLYIEFTKLITTTTKFSGKFDLAFSALLASCMALQLTGSQRLKELMEALYTSYTDDAGTVDALQGKNIQIKSNSLIKVR